YKKILKYLYNFKNIDKTIDNIKLDMISYNNLGYNNWIKSISNNGKTLEDKIIDMDNNHVILRLKKWKKLISEILEYYKKTDNIKYQYICLKYFENKSIEEIKSQLKLNRKEQRDMQADILQYIFLFSIRKKLLKNE
ncbi:MAG: hypothetical protein J6D03_10700, partial [Clostridia bacterium]|nr:hypothetical protein [Clostridia bacterium]